MAVCDYCKQEMTEVVGCTLPVYDDFRDGVTRSRTKTGNRGCPACSAPPRSWHHPGCDLERCPACGRQAMTCGCAVLLGDPDDDMSSLS